MSNFVAWPEIGQFRNAIKAICSRVQWSGTDSEGNPVFDRTKKLPVVKFIGTVKSHGTNAAVRLNADGTTEYQSRNNDITPLKDNAAFAFNMSAIDFTPIRNMFAFMDQVIIFGEWCGGNIQKGVALSQLPKMFIIFGIQLDGKWLDMQQFKHVKMPEQNIFNVFDFKTFEIDIDMNDPASSQNKLIEMTIEVEDECPIGKHFGVSGVGEGIVFVPADPMFQFSDARFKSKGEKHSVSKVKKLNSVDTEKLDSIKEFVTMVVTEARLNQALEFLASQQLSVDVKNTGVFLKWFVGDVIKEETDSMIANGLEPKDCNAAVSKAAREWYFDKLNQQVGL